jgi:gliding motility-associated-like protein
VQWTSIISSNTYYYFAPVEVSDGYIFTGATNGSNLVTFYKLNKQGGLMWGGKKTTDFSGVPPLMRQRNNGNIITTFRKNISGQSRSVVVELDKELNVIGQSALADASLNLEDISITKQGTGIMAGLLNSQPFFAKTDVAFRSGCDVMPPPVIFTTDPADFLAGSTSEINYAMAAASENFLYPVVTHCSPSKSLSLGNDTLVCDGTLLLLQNKTAALFDHYRWSTGESTSYITVTASGIYSLIAYDDCISDTLFDTLVVTTRPSPNSSLGPDAFLCEGETVTLLAPSCSDCIFLWGDGSTGINLPVNSEGKYWLQVTGSNTCSSSDTMQVLTGKCDCSVYLPSAFSPNNDGINDLFLPVYYCEFAEYHLQVFNRWGMLVFETHNPHAAWNGKVNEQATVHDIYHYKLSYTPVIKGKTNRHSIKTGSLAVVY